MPRPPSVDSAAGTYTWRRLLLIIAGYRRQLLAANGLGIAAVVASVPVPLLLPRLVDEVLLHRPGAALARPGILCCGSPGCRHAAARGRPDVDLGRLRLSSSIVKDLGDRLRRDTRVHRRVHAAELETLGSGQLASRLIADIETIDDFLAHGVGGAPIALLNLALLVVAARLGRHAGRLKAAEAGA